MRWGAVLLGLVAAFTAMAQPAAGEERAFFDGLEARMIGPYRGGRAMVAVGVRQDPHVYYMGINKRPKRRGSFHPTIFLETVAKRVM